MPSSTEPGWSCADLWDVHHGHAVVALLPWRDFGGCDRFAGRAATLRTRDDHGAVRSLLELPGEGRVLVIDGGGAMRIAMLGDRLAAIGAVNGWAGVVVNGPVRDAAVLKTIDIGVKALGVTPMRSFGDAPRSERDVAVTLGDATVRPGAWIYCDPDGVIVADRALA